MLSLGIEMNVFQTKYDCNIIPIGAIEVGGPFERALLFKMLADRIPLATTLKMDEQHHRIVYNEVAVPIYDDMVWLLACFDE